MIEFMRIFGAVFWIAFLQAGHKEMTFALTLQPTKVIQSKFLL